MLFAGAFNHPDVFDKQFTAEGQLVAFLVDANLNFDFLDAFFDGNFSVRFPTHRYRRRANL